MSEENRPTTLRALLARLNAEGVTDYRRYQAVRKFLNFKARDKGVPISGSFELTPLCNLDCKMCYVHLNKEQMKGAKLLTAEQWKDIMRQAIDAGMMYARLTGGECLTYPAFRELYLFLRNRGIEIAILSNGLLMDEGMVEFLSANPPSAIQVTLYGASEDTYERVTGHRFFGRVTENLRRIREAGIPLTIAVTPSEYMTDGEEILEFLHKEGFDYQINAGLMQPREETGRALADAALDSYVTLMKMRMAYYGSEAAPECDPEGLPEPGGSQREGTVGVRCGAGRSGFSIDWKGGMRPCNTFPCGAQNVLEMGFGEAWRRTNYTANTFVLPIECEGCVYKGVCKHCVAEHASGAEIGHANKMNCAWTQRMVAEGLLTIAKT